MVLLRRCLPLLRRLAEVVLVAVAGLRGGFRGRRDDRWWPFAVADSGRLGCSHHPALALRGRRGRSRWPSSVAVAFVFVCVFVCRSTAVA